MKTGMWKTRGGEVLKIANMTDTHLVNTINFLIRTAPVKLDALQDNAFTMVGFVQSEMALDMAENALDAALDTIAEDILFDAPMKTLLHHARKRKLLDTIDFGNLNKEYILMLAFPNKSVKTPPTTRRRSFSGDPRQKTLA